MRVAQEIIDAMMTAIVFDAGDEFVDLIPIHFQQFPVHHDRFLFTGFTVVELKVAGPGPIELLMVDYLNQIDIEISAIQCLEPVLIALGIKKVADHNGDSRIFADGGIILQAAVNIGMTGWFESVKEFKYFKVLLFTPGRWFNFDDLIVKGHQAGFVHIGQADITQGGSNLFGRDIFGRRTAVH